MKRTTLSTSESALFFGKIVQKYCDLIDQFNKSDNQIASIIDTGNYEGGIISYFNNARKHIASLKDYQIQVLENLYTFMSAYYTNIGQDIAEAYKNSEDLLYTESMSTYFYNNANTGGFTTPIANKIGDPFSLPEDYNYVEVALDGDKVPQDAYKNFFPQGSGNDARVKYAKMAVDNIFEDQEGNKKVFVYGVLSTTSTNFEKIQNDTGIDPTIIEKYNISIGRMNENGTFKDGVDIIIPAYLSEEPKFVNASLSNATSYNAPTFNSIDEEHIYEQNQTEQNQAIENTIEEPDPITYQEENSNLGENYE